VSLASALGLAVLRRFLEEPIGNAGTNTHTHIYVYSDVQHCLHTSHTLPGTAAQFGRTSSNGRARDTATAAPGTNAAGRQLDLSLEHTQQHGSITAARFEYPFGQPGVSAAESPTRRAIETHPPRSLNRAWPRASRWALLSAAADTLDASAQDVRTLGGEGMHRWLGGSDARVLWDA
jgi:hypothetical protein